jgi:hypothetical protein
VVADKDRRADLEGLRRALTILVAAVVGEILKREEMVAQEL